MCARKFPLFGSSRMLVMLNRLADMAGLLETSADVVQGPRPVFSYGEPEFLDIPKVAVNIFYIFTMAM